jgi:hypothetical protein
MTHRIEIEFDDRCYEGLVAEAERLNVGVEDVVDRAAAAWLIDLAENSLVKGPSSHALAR